MSDDISLVILPRAHDVGGFEVRRALPAQQRQMVGPFIFFDQMGPGEFLAGNGLDVRPHPHIGLSTVTYLFEGSIQHRDSLGSDQPILPGDVNWMTAGRGIAHSERSSAESRQARRSLAGIQSWVALPKSAEETAPDFAHHAAATLPFAEEGGLALRLIAGEGWGMRAPVAVSSPLFYADAVLAPGASVPMPDQHEERAAYVLEGEVTSRRGDAWGGADAGLPPALLARAQGRAAGGAAAAAGRRGHGRAAACLLELRQLLARADRAGQGGLAGGAVRQGAERCGGVHPAAGEGADRAEIRKVGEKVFSPSPSSISGS